MTHGLLEDFRRAPRTERWSVAMLLAIGIAVRLVHVRQPMRHDEAYTFLHYASAPLSSALSDYTYPNNHLFHTLLVWLTTRVIGGSPEAIRVPAFVAGTLLLPAVYLLARRFADRGAALVALGLAAAWPALVLYSTNARGYSIVVLVFAGLLLLGERAIDEAARWTWLWIGVLLFVGTYTAPVMLYPGGAALLWMPVEAWRRHGWRGARRVLARAAATGTLAGLAAALAYLPAVRRSGLEAVVANRYVTPLPLRDLVGALPAFAGDLVVSLGLGIPLPALALLGFAGAVGLFAPGPDRARRATLAATVLGWCALLLLLTRRPPPSRVWLFLVPIACVYAGAGLSAGARWLARGADPGGARSSATLAISLALVMSGWALVTRAVFRSPETGTLVDAPEIAGYLLARLGPGDRVVVASPCDVPLDYYLRRQGRRSLSGINGSAARGRVFVVVDPRHLQTLGGVQAGARDIPWSALRPDAEPAGFPQASVHGFRFVAQP